ncbi:AMP-binding protein [Streptomyces mayonensis]|uniref:AMP-binding protein n=1 Tax=Streptomyces mayonensis TaxID=2750816 RepID=UPI001C1E63DC|nr:AMP-binding protein [Streptomyces sp. A108]MBU6533035.1 AMP-binding protein [Streptomyces sp. A108]
MSDAWVCSVLQTYEGDPAPAHRYVDGDGRARELSRAGLLDEVRESARRLAARGGAPGSRVALLAGDPGRFVPAFLGAIWAGFVPVPLPPPPVLGRRDAWSGQLTASLAVARPDLVVAEEATLALLPATPARRLSYEALESASPEAGTGTGTGGTGTGDVGQDGDVPAPAAYRPDRIAYLQFSSGSTGRPRAVVATAGAVTANSLAIMRDGLAADPARDHGVSWLPLHHDMGLVGFVLAPLAVGVPVTLLATRLFVRDPGSWMRTLSDVRGTITGAPNFAYALATRRASEDRLAGLDLSAAHTLLCGGEPVSPRTLRHFADAHRAAGLDPAALRPCYGLAESTLAVSVAPRGTAWCPDRVSWARLRDHDRADPCGDDEEAVEVPGCGPPLPGHEVRVVDAAGLPRGEREVGEIWVRGPSVCAGYLDEARDRPAPLTGDGWLRTGDRGYLADGVLHPAGRLKDVLVVQGRNVDPQRVEWAAESVDGVRAGGTVAFTRPGTDTEEVVVVAECRPYRAAGIAGAVRETVSQRLGLGVADVVAVGPGTVAKTTSGKPRRQEMRRRYLVGDLLPAPAAAPPSGTAPAPAAAPRSGTAPAPAAAPRCGTAPVPLPVPADQQRP